MSGSLLLVGRAATGYGPDSPPSRHSPPSRQQPRATTGPSRSAAGAPAGRDRLYEIDLLRITAALAVVFYHYTFSGYAGHLNLYCVPGPQHRHALWLSGRRQCFFTISGFVVLLSALGTAAARVRHFPDRPPLPGVTGVAVTITAIVAITPQATDCSRSRPTQVCREPDDDQLAAPTSRTSMSSTGRCGQRSAFYVLVFRARVDRHHPNAGRHGAVAVARRDGGDRGATSCRPAWRAPSTCSCSRSGRTTFIAGMALCLIYRTGFSWPLGARIGDRVRQRGCIRRSSFGHPRLRPLPPGSCTPR